MEERKGKKTAIKIVIAAIAIAVAAAAVIAAILLQKNDISSCAIELSETTFYYDGNAHQPEVTVTDPAKRSGDAALERDRHYTVEYADNVKAGTGKVIVTGIGRYEGELEASFDIIKKDQTISLYDTPDEIHLLPGDSTQLKAVTDGDGEISWISDNGEVASVDEYGAVTAAAPGSAVITGTAAETDFYYGDSLAVLISVGSGIEVPAPEAASAESETEDADKTQSGSSDSSGSGGRVTVFAGDSILSGLDPQYSTGLASIGFGGEKYLVASKSLNTNTFQTSTVFGGQTGVQNVISHNPTRVYLMLGMNEVNWRSVSSSMDSYRGIIQSISDSCPNADIVILACPPVTAAMAASDPGYQNIPAFNSALVSLASELGVRYYDYTEPLKDGSGYLNAAYSNGDGCHWNNSGYLIFAQQITAYDNSLE